MPSSRSGGHTERRAFGRVDLSFSVRVWRDEATLELRSQNISAGGVKLVFGSGEVDPPFEVGECVDLEFRLPVLPEAVVTKGEVRWITSNMCGVQFTALHARVVSAINRIHSRG